MTVINQTVSRMLFAYDRAAEVPRRNQRHKVEAYINDLRVELERAQELLDAIDGQPKPRRNPCTPRP